LVWLALIEIEGETFPEVIVMTLLVAVVVVKQLALLVNTHVIKSFAFRVELGYVALLLPTLMPLSFHW
jgi:hypothetical protein